MKIFAETAPLYLEAGYFVMPLKRMSKDPIISGYPAFSHTPPNEDTYQEWVKKYAENNIGVILGASSGVCVVDFDHLEKKIVDEIMVKITPAGYLANCRRVGKKNFAVFFRYNPEVNNAKRSWQIDGQVAIDFLSDGRYIVIPPSFHPDTRARYYWPEGCEPLYLQSKDELPLFPKNGFEIISGIINSHHEKSTKTDHSKSAFIRFNEGDPYIRETSNIALMHLDKWVPEFFPHFKKRDDYYQGIPPYRASDNPTGLGISPRGIVDFSEKWYSAVENDFVTGRPYTAPGILFRVDPDRFKSVLDAANYLRRLLDPGFFTEANTIATNIILSSSRASTANTAVKIKEPVFPFHLLDNVPNLLGEVYSFISSNLRFKQDVLSIGAALTVVGGLIAQRFMTPTNLICNFFNIALAPSSSGKEQVRQSIINIFDNLGEDGIIIEEIASSPGLLKALSDRGGEGIFLNDEFGRELSRINSKKSSEYKAAIVDAIMKLSSIPYTPLVKKTEYAQAREGHKDLYAPCLNSFNTTVAQPFFNALTSSSSVDGFLGRALIWESENPNPHPDKANLDVPSRAIVPVELLEKMLTLRESPKYNPSDHDLAKNEFVSKRAKKNMVAVMAPKIIPKVVQISPEAKEVFKKLHLVSYERKQVLLEEEKGLEALWGRLVEQATKIALAASNFKQIEKTEAEWAAELAIYQAEIRTYRALFAVYDSETEQTRKRLLSTIKSYYYRNQQSPMPCSKLQKSWGAAITSAQFNDALIFLLETDQIQAVSLKTGGYTDFTAATKASIGFIPLDSDAKAA